MASSDEAISLSEETEIHRIVNQLKILPQDLIKLRVLHGRFLPGRSPGTPTRTAIVPVRRSSTICDVEYRHPPILSCSATVRDVP